MSIIMHCIGSGCSKGIPRLRCNVDVCRQARRYKKGKNFRRRSSLLISFDAYKVLMDTPIEIKRLLDHGQVDMEKIGAILLSHRHADHLYGIAEFEIWPDPLIIIAGRGTISHAKKLAGKNDNFEFIQARSKKRIDLAAGLQITPFSVKHSVAAYGYILQYDNKKIMYFSDSNSDLNKWHIQNAREADLVIFNTPTFGIEMNDHITVKKVIALTKKHKFKKAMLSHIGHKNLSHRQLEAELEKEFGRKQQKIIVAYDGLKLCL